VSQITRIALIGFGEVGQILAKDLSARGVGGISAWDVKFADPESIASKALPNYPVRAAHNAEDAVQDADLVISAVTAAQDVEAATAAARGIRRAACFLDLNSCSPGMKQEAAYKIEAAGARYVEGSVMSPIGPKRIATAILLGGPHAEGILPLLHDLGFAGTSFFSAELGRAAATKMCRSVIVKGMEALLSESLLVGRYYGVEETVLRSLGDLFPGRDWRALSHYMISRALEHGTRRAEEMREVARTVEEAGLTPWMSAACAERQDWAAQFKGALGEEDLGVFLDAIRAAMNEKNKESKLA
jgi:3-hydroxyisobutyrate dehydrogenase-like beta-hydroxyacid dehydrogenase